MLGLTRTPSAKDINELEAEDGPEPLRNRGQSSGALGRREIDDMDKEPPAPAFVDRINFTAAATTPTLPSIPTPTPATDLVVQQVCNRSTI